MKTLDESVALSMDCEDLRLLPFLPYILHDFSEMGSRATWLAKIIKELRPSGKMKVLDLGCGKGLVSLAVAREPESECLGIDAVGDFIDCADRRRREENRGNCRFMVGDVRDLSFLDDAFDFIILGSIGPIFESYSTALASFRRLLKAGGRIILDEGYTEEGWVHPVTLGKRALFDQIDQAGFLVEKEYLGDEICPANEYEGEFDKISQRCQELIAIHPDKADLFSRYIAKQAAEYDSLENEITCSTMVLRGRTGA